MQNYLFITYFKIVTPLTKKRNTISCAHSKLLVNQTSITTLYVVAHFAIFIFHLQEH